MELRFTNKGAFKRDLREDLTEHIIKYIKAAQDYQLGQESQLPLFHNILDGKAKLFYRGKVKNRCGTFREAINTIQDEIYLY